MIKVVILQNWLAHYRKDLLNRLCAEGFLVTVIHSGLPVSSKSDLFDERIVKHIRFKNYRYQVGILSMLKDISPSIIVADPDIHCVSTLLAVLKNKNTKIVLWGLESSRWAIVNTIKSQLVKKAHSILAYSPRKSQELIQAFRPQCKVVVANNTVHVPHFSRKSTSNNERYSILCVGSIAYRKRYDITIQSYANILAAVPGLLNKTNLVFVGSGSQRKDLEKLCTNLRITNNVEFNDECLSAAELNKYYSRAIFCTSYGQAGLSVLQSLGYGVPYLTTAGAINSGEIENIINGFNGFLTANSQEAYQEKMKSLILDPALCKKMVTNAKGYYMKHASIDAMVRSFNEALA